jgi:hypothetical protein
MIRTRSSGHDMNEQNFFEQFSHGVSSELPKYAQMREILIAAIAAGHWKQGEQLPKLVQITFVAAYHIKPEELILLDTGK